jgi:hypothetical protein
MFKHFLTRARSTLVAVAVGLACTASAATYIVTVD